MQILAIPASECQYYDYSQAAAYFIKSGCLNTPQLGLLTYYQNDNTETSTVGWYAEENGVCYPLPVFKAFYDNDSEAISFSPMDEHEIFFCDKCLYMTISVNGKLCIRRINVLFDESIAGAFHSICGLQETELELCKIYRRGELLGYYWVGKQDNASTVRQPTLILSPAFGDDDGVFNVRHSSELKVVKVEIGETIIHKATWWQIGYNEQYGITIVRIMDIPDNSKSGRYMLN